MPLLVCAPGANHSLQANANTALGANVGLVLDNLENPPAVLCVTNTKTLQELYASMNADLAFVWGFSYPITKRMLRCKAPFVNYHPAPLPLMRGPFVFPPMVLDPCIELKATWYYIVEGIDQGPIIQEVSAQLLEGKNRHAATSENIWAAYVEAFFRSFDSSMDLIESGFPGTPQGQELPSHSGTAAYCTYFSDEERMIRNEMTAAEAMRLFRALEGTGMKALFTFEERLYYVVSMFTDQTVCEGKLPKRVGWFVIQDFRGEKLKLGIRRI